MIVDVRLTVADVEHESPKLEARSSKEKMLEARSWKEGVEMRKIRGRASGSP